jgi:hypothetical protein
MATLSHIVLENKWMIACKKKHQLRFTLEVENDSETPTALLSNEYTCYAEEFVPWHVVIC